MKRTTITLILAVILVLAMAMPVSAAIDLQPIGGVTPQGTEGISLFSAVPLGETDAEFAGGTGTEQDPYLIETKAQLNNVRNYLSAYFKLAADIEFTESDFAAGGAFYNEGAGWVPIGANANNAFTGVFDGNGHTIRGLQVNISGTSTVYAGLFKGNKGTIQNLGMTEGSVSAKTTSNYAYAGGIAGYNYGTISNSYNTGSVSASSKYAYVGGIAGDNSGTISDSYNTGSVSASSSSSSSKAYAGGIAGYNDEGTISNSYNTGSVSASSSFSSYAGGIAGSNSSSGTIEECYYLDIITKGVGSGTDSCVKCSAEEMQKQSTFAGFDFESVWSIE